MRVLFICKDNPFGIGGADFATHAYLKAFSDICGGNIDVFMAEDITAGTDIRVANYHFVPPRSLISRFFSVVSGHLHRNVRPVLAHLNKDHSYDYCVFNNSKTSSGLLDAVKQYGIKVVTIHHNCEVEYVRDNTPNPLIRMVLLYHVRNSERKAYYKSDYNLFLTEQDLATFAQQYGNNPKRSFLLGAFEYKKLKGIQENTRTRKSLTFAITGSLCTVQGVDGIKFFFESLFDRLPHDSGVIISGRAPSKEVIQLCKANKRVKLIANPVDMSEVISQADVYICPTRLGGGLKLRVMDGLRLGLPVITHSCSARGYDVFKGTGLLFVYDTPDEFGTSVNQVVELFYRGELSRSVVFDAYSREFSYEAGLNRLQDILAR